MAPPTKKKRKVSPLSGRDRNEIYVQDTAGHVSEDSSNAESEIFPRNEAIRSGQATIETRRNATTSWSSGKYDSSLFKLKANELLTKMRPNYERRMVKAENSLRRLKDIIERIPDRDPKPVRNLAVDPV